MSLEDVGMGVANPKLAELAPGGPIRQICFKPLRPGVYKGFYESYMSEIAAYELDKLLNLGMVPPTVEKRIERDNGAAIMWLETAKTFKELGGSPRVPRTQKARWVSQLIRAKMFHNLIYNKDPNLGNWMIDPAWNLILIDNTRAFTTSTRMAHTLKRIDRALWEQFEALDEPTLDATVGGWLTTAEVRAILKRRDKMAEEIARRVAEQGETAVFGENQVQSPAAPALASQQTNEGLSDLAGQLEGALEETPVLLPVSELAWVGRVVRLGDYQGPDAHLAKAAVDQGHTHGIVTEVDGLLCLTSDARHAAHYEAVTGMAGKQAEVFGFVTREDGMKVVSVTLSRGVS